MFSNLNQVFIEICQKISVIEWIVVFLKIELSFLLNSLYAKLFIFFILRGGNFFIFVAEFANYNNNDNQQQKSTNGTG